MLLRDAALNATDPTVRLSAQQLFLAVEQLETKLKDTFVHTGEDLGEVFAAYAAEHGQNSGT